MRPTYYEVLYYETYGELQRTKEKLDKMTGRWNRAVREVRKLRAELDKYRLQQVDEFDAHR